MRVNVIRIPCRDLNESLKFYEGSLGLVKTFGTPDIGYIGFQLENAQLLLEYEEPGEFECGRYLGFSVSVDNLGKFYDDSCARGVEFTCPPQKQEWGRYMTHLKDCSGNTFSIVQDPP